MSKNEADILLIRKYLAGELDARAMHQLEARAQDDPFLMDALEGYEKAGPDQQNHLADLTGRLQQRVERKERRIIPFRVLAIAASILVVFTIGWLWLGNTQKQTLPKIVQLAKPAVKPLAAPQRAQDTVIASRLAANTPAFVKQRVATVRPAGTPAPVVANDAVAVNPALNEISIAKPNAAADKDTTPLNEMVVMDYSAKQKKAAADTGVNSQGFSDKYAFKSKPAATNDVVLPSLAPGVQKTPAQSPFSSPQPRQIVLQGKVIDLKDGTPLPGASVRVKGTNYGAVTDNNGKFSLRVDSNKSKLEVGFIGYNTAKVDVRNRDSLKTIALEPDSKSLSEVVVTKVNPPNENGYGQTVTAAHPRDGWKSLTKYLKENAISPDGKKGTVKLSFTVNANGRITGITIVSGISPATNQKAIDLISDGPQWVGPSNGKPGQVKLRVKFGAGD